MLKFFMPFEKEKLKQCIENDDLESFKSYFSLENWKESITKIENYAGVTKHTPEITYNDADCIKYALHCNSDKIFNYLLPLVDTEKHGDNYGWPLLSMAIKNKRYDYANKIIKHPEFNSYSQYHVNCFMYIDSHEKTEEHIKFLFNYLENFSIYDFKNKTLVHLFSHLICHNEDTFKQFETIYKNKHNNKDVELLNMFKHNPSILFEEIFKRKYNKFIIDKLNDNQIRHIFESIMDDNIIFTSLFESENAKDGLIYLLKNSDLLQTYIDKNPIIVSYLNLDCILFLIDNKIDIFKENDKNASAFDYILDNNNIKEPSTWYFINNYTQYIYDRLEQKNRNNSIKKYCYQKLLDDSLLNINTNKSKTITKI